MHIAMVAGEVSGDILGAGLIKALKQIYPQARFSGIGGERMVAEGFESLFPMDRLSVMGIVEPLKRLPELLRMRKRIKQHCLEQNVDAFIGIDSPDFTLNIEAFAKKHGIASIHYVSPSVWAWRQGRIKGIKQAVDLMLCLLPFEADFYHQHQVKACFVGHPLADDIALDSQSNIAREQLDIDAKQQVVALMPGSRGGEVALMGDLFLQVASSLVNKYPQIDWLFLIPAANADRKAQLQQLLQSYSKLNMRLFDGQSHTVMAASDMVLLTSGTTALEAMLLKKPMVVAYKTAALSYAILSRMVKTPFISLPNLLAGKALVPELIQAHANLPNLLQATEQALFDEDYQQQQVASFYQLHQQIKADASQTAAKAIQALLEGRA